MELLVSNTMHSTVLHLLYLLHFTIEDCWIAALAVSPASQPRFGDPWATFPRGDGVETSLRPPLPVLHLLTFCTSSYRPATKDLMPVAIPFPSPSLHATIPSTRHPPTTVNNVLLPALPSLPPSLSYRTRRNCSNKHRSTRPRPCGTIPDCHPELLDTYSIQYYWLHFCIPDPDTSHRTHVGGIVSPPIVKVYSPPNSTENGLPSTLSLIAVHRSFQFPLLSESAVSIFPA